MSVSPQTELLTTAMHCLSDLFVLIVHLTNISPGTDKQQRHRIFWVGALYIPQAGNIKIMGESTWKYYSRHKEFIFYNFLGTYLNLFLKKASVTIGYFIGQS